VKEQETVSHEVLKAIRDALVSYLKGKVPTFNPKATTFHFTDAFIDPPDCPAISILDRGWTTVDETCRSQDLTGAAVGGMLWRRFSVEIQPWLTAGGQDDAELRRTLRAWCDGIASVLDSYYRLGSTQLVAKPTAGANFETFPAANGLWFGAGQITASVDVYIRQGEVSL